MGKNDFKIEEFRDEIEKHYMDESGQVTIDRDPTPNSTGNGVMHTGHFICVLAENEGIILTKDMPFWSRYTDSITVDNKNGGKYYGVINRSVWKKSDLVSHDEYVGFMTGNYFLSKDQARAVVNYGKSNGYSYNNLRPEPSKNPHELAPLDTYHDRFPGQVTFYRYAASDSPSVWEVPAFVSRVMSSVCGDDDSRVQSYCMLSVAKREFAPLHAVDFVWKLLVRRKFGTLGNSWVRYYKPGHPMTTIP